MLDGVAAELQRIIAEPVQHQKSQGVLPLNLCHKSSSKFHPANWDKLTGLLFDA